MAKEALCPACDAEILLDGNEKQGDEVFCSYCNVPFRVTKAAGEDSDIEVEEDY